MCIDDSPGWRNPVEFPFRRGDIVVVERIDLYPIDGIKALHLGFAGDPRMWSAARFREL